MSEVTARMEGPMLVLDRPGLKCTVYEFDPKDPKAVEIIANWAYVGKEKAAELLASLAKTE